MRIFVNIPDGFRDNSFITENIRKKLEAMAEVRYNAKDKPLSGDELRGELENADAVITGWGQPLIKKEDIGSVKVIAHTGGTVGGIVDLGVFDAGVTVLSGNSYYADSVAEGVIAYMLYALRDMGNYGRMIPEGKWIWDAKTKGLIDRSVGIISYGAISSRVIPILRCFTDDIRVYSTRRNEKLAMEQGFRYASLEEIFAECDIVSVHTAKNAETYHMINKKHFDLLKDGALFINTARGAVIDEEALIEALEEKRFSALLDVYESEPPKADSKLRELENVMLFPHMAGPTYDRREGITSALIDDVAAYFAGRTPKNVVSKQTAEKMTVS